MLNGTLYRLVYSGSQPSTLTFSSPCPGLRLTIFLLPHEFFLYLLYGSRVIDLHSICARGLPLQTLLEIKRFFVFL